MNATDTNPATDAITAEIARLHGSGHTTTTLVTIMLATGASARIVRQTLEALGLIVENAGGPGSYRFGTVTLTA